jgi:hypothetical protein
MTVVPVVDVFAVLVLVREGVVLVQVAVRPDGHRSVNMGVVAVVVGVDVLVPERLVPVAVAVAFEGV